MLARAARATAFAPSSVVGIVAARRGMIAFHSSLRASSLCPTTGSLSGLPGEPRARCRSRYSPWFATILSHNEISSASRPPPVQRRTLVHRSNCDGLSIVVRSQT